MKILLPISILLLSGCATTQPVPKTVEVPVAVPCKVKGITAPDFAYDHIKKGADVDEQVKGLLIDHHQRVSYEAQLEAAIKTCE